MVLDAEVYSILTLHHFLFVWQMQDKRKFLMCPYRVCVVMRAEHYKAKKVGFKNFR